MMYNGGNKFLELICVFGLFCFLHKQGNSQTFVHRIFHNPLHHNNALFKQNKRSSKIRCRYKCSLKYTFNKGTELNTVPNTDGAYEGLTVGAVFTTPLVLDGDPEEEQQATLRKYVKHWKYFQSELFVSQNWTHNPITNIYN